MVFTSQIFASQEDERAFRRNVEGLLREGKAGMALEAVDAKLNEVADRPFAQLALAIAPESVTITGWNTMVTTMEALDVHGQSISAVGIDFSNPVHFGNQPDADMRLQPVLETNYYCDDVFPFSTSSREAVNAGYGRSGARWQGGFEHSDSVIGVKGLDAVYGAYHAVRPQMDRGELPEPADCDAPRLAAIRSAVLLHMAIARAIDEKGMPRAMTVLCGSNEDFPFFDAPVITRAEYEEATDAQAEAGDTDEALFTSLTIVAPARPNANYRFTPETEHVSGRSLRHRLVREDNEAANSDEIVDPVAAEEASRRASLFDRLFRRSA